MPFHHLFFVASAFFLALGSVFAKYLLSLAGEAGAFIDPLPFVSLQLAGSLVFLFGIYRLKGLAMPERHLLGKIVVPGLFVGFGALGTIMALALIPAGEASVIFAVQPVIILGVAWLMLRERSGLDMIFLSLVAVSGVILIVINGADAESSLRLSGILFALLSTVCAAVYVVLMRGLSQQADVLTSLIVVQLVALVIAVLSCVFMYFSGISEVRTGSVFLAVSAVFTGVIYYGVAFYVYLLGLQKSPASVAGVYLSLVPVFTILLAGVLLDERLRALQWMGVVLVVGAVLLISALSGRSRGQV